MAFVLALRDIYRVIKMVWWCNHFLANICFINIAAAMEGNSSESGNYSS